MAASSQALAAGTADAAVTYAPYIAPVLAESHAVRVIYTAAESRD